MQKILFFGADIGEQTCDEFESLIANHVKQSPRDIEIVSCHNFIALAGHLILKSGDIQIAVLILSNESELDLVLQFADLFDHLELILILPNHESHLISKAHLLRPRFIASMSDNREIISGIIDKKIRDMEGVQEVSF